VLIECEREVKIVLYASQHSLENIKFPEYENIKQNSRDPHDISTKFRGFRWIFDPSIQLERTRRSNGFTPPATAASRQFLFRLPDHPNSQGREG
jgi:hypothetical protein